MHMQVDQSVLRLDSVPIGTEGAWALNLWFQVNSTATARQTGVQYLLSQGRTNLEKNEPLNPSQVRLMSCMGKHRDQET